MSSIGFRTRFSAAVFFSPFLAARMNHIMLGSFHSSLISTNAFVPRNDAAAVMSGKRINSGGTPTASEFAVMIALRAQWDSKQMTNPNEPPVHFSAAHPAMAQSLLP